MSNSFYNHASGVPIAQSRGTSSSLRSEFDAIALAFDGLAGVASSDLITDTSVTSVTIAIGLATFTVSAGRLFVPGMYLVIANTPAASTNSLWCQVTSYSGTTLNVDVKSIAGGGTYAAWSISRSAPNADLAGATFGAPSKATPADADLLPLVDSAAANVLKSLSWANLKIALRLFLSGTTFPIGTTTPSTATFTTVNATSFVGPLTGNASTATTAATATNATTATTATNATNATNLATASDNASNANYFPLWTSVENSTQAVKTSGGKISFNPAAGILNIVGYFNGALNGIVGNITPSTGAFTTLNATGQLLLNGTTGNSANNRLLVKGLSGDDRIAIETANTGSVTSIEAQDTGYWTTPTYSGTAIVQFGAAYAGTTAGVANAGLGALRFQNNTGGLIYTNGSSPIVLATAAVERMRISSIGQVGVAMPPNGNAQLQVSQASSPYGFELFAATGGTQVGQAYARLLNNANTVERLSLVGFSDTLSVIGAASILAFNTASVERLRLDATNLTTALSIIAGPNLTTGQGVSTANCGIEIGGNRTGIGAAYIDFHGTNGTDFETRIIRNSGVNGSMDYNNLGTGGHNFYNNSGLGLVISSTGSVTATQSLTLGIGGAYVAGSIYCDGTWGMLFRSKQAAPANAEFRWANSVDTELMRLTSAGGVIAVGTVTGSNLSGTNTGDTPAWVIKTTNYTAVAGDALLANTTGGVFTITLPAAPAALATVRIADYNGNLGINKITVVRNGQNINALAEDMDITTPWLEETKFTFIDATVGWRTL